MSHNIFSLFVCTFLLCMVRCGIWERCIVAIVNLVYDTIAHDVYFSSDSLALITDHDWVIDLTTDGLAQHTELLGQQHHICVATHKVETSFWHRLCMSMLLRSFGWTEVKELFQGTEIFYNKVSWYFATRPCVTLVLTLGKLKLPWCSALCIKRFSFDRVQHWIENIKLSPCFVIPFSE